MGLLCSFGLPLWELWVGCFGGLTVDEIPGDGALQLDVEMQSEGCLCDFYSQRVAYVTLCWGGWRDVVGGADRFGSRGA